MARIRNVKPDFFRHEVLQGLELSRPDLYPMLVFCGLWGLCDKLGQFEWKPRQIHLDILPFLGFDMEETLLALQHADMLRHYEVDGKAYGVIPTFHKHQRLGGKEAKDPPRFPSASPVLPKPMPQCFTDASQGSDGEASGKHQGSVFANVVNV